MQSKDEFKEALNQILEVAGTDPGKVSEILMDLNSNYDEVMGEYQSLTEKIEELSTTNASLVKANGELFRHVGLVKEPEETPEETPEEPPAMPGIEDVMEKILPMWGAK